MPVGIIDKVDHEGRGVLWDEERAVCIEGALPGEHVSYTVTKHRPSYALARLEQVLSPSAQRVVPRCRYFSICGGCSMQHLDATAQAAVKQRVLEDALWDIARLRAQTVFPAIHGPSWGYRLRARIGARLVPKKGGVLVGFRERRSSYIADMLSCEILPPHVSRLLPALRELIGGLSIPDRLPQIELAVGDTQTVLVFRHLQPLIEADQARLSVFAEKHDVQVWLQSKGPDTVKPLCPADPPGLSYALPEFGLTMAFRPTDFTQVNVDINRLLIRRAMQLLAPQPGERIADLFCGLGNFSLPIARSGAYVLGFEAGEALVQRAAENAAHNDLAERAEFHVADLFQATQDSLAALGQFDKMLIDPPRDGALSVVKGLGPGQSPKRIVYVSCNPMTLARDAAVLVHEKGYALRGAGIANMFPQTSHVESIAVFEAVA